MNSDFNLQNALNIYEESIKTAKTLGFDRDEAKKIALSDVRKIYPNLKMYDSTSTLKFFGKTSGIINRYYPKAGRIDPKPRALKKKKNNEDIDLIVRELAHDGFVPAVRYLKPFLGEQKASQIYTTIARMRKEGWQIKNTKWGYECSPPSPRQPNITRSGKPKNPPMIDHRNGGSTDYEERFARIEFAINKLINRSSR
jgi:hypothetical protein